MTEAMRQKMLNEIAEAVRKAFESDPGTSDLHNEQPITITVPLGIWRKASLVHLVKVVPEGKGVRS